MDVEQKLLRDRAYTLVEIINVSAKEACYCSEYVQHNAEDSEKGINVWIPCFISEILRLERKKCSCQKICLRGRFGQSAFTSA